MYGWRRAVVLASAAQASFGAEVRLVPGLDIRTLVAAWEKGELLGGGLDGAFWTAQQLPSPAPARALLYGTVPESLEAAAIVGAGRALREWLT
jgi:hypothetical protein